MLSKIGVEQQLLKEVKDLPGRDIAKKAGKSVKITGIPKGK